MGTRSGSSGPVIQGRYGTRRAVSKYARFWPSEFQPYNSARSVKLSPSPLLGDRNDAYNGTLTRAPAGTLWLSSSPTARYNGAWRSRSDMPSTSSPRPVSFSERSKRQ